MNKMLNILPESDHPLTQPNKEELKQYILNNEMICVKAGRYNIYSDRLNVEIAPGIYGYISKDDFSIYPFNVKAAIAMCGKKICVTVKEFDGELVVLSRKEVMETAINSLLIGACPQKAYIGNITGLSNSGLFADIGCGVTVRVPIQELSQSPFKDPHDLLFDIGQKITVHFNSFDSNTNYIKADYRKYLKDSINDYFSRQIIKGIVRLPVKDSDDNITGYFVHISPNVNGIVDIPKKNLDDLLYYPDELEYGKEFYFTIQYIKYDKNGLSLRIPPKNM